MLLSGAVVSAGVPEQGRGDRMQARVGMFQGLRWAAASGRCW
jgi:hypothetical protein